MPMSARSTRTGRPGAVAVSKDARNAGDTGACRSTGAEPGADDRSAATTEGVDPSGRPADRTEAAADYAAARHARSAAGRAAYFYAVVRVVPNVERGERFNAGVVLFSRSLRFLGMRTALDRPKLAVLAPGCDPEPIARQLDALRAVADGMAEGGPVARLDQAERFHWLSSPGSTMIQPSPVHTGLTSDPAATLDRLFRSLVLG